MTVFLTVAACLLHLHQVSAQQECQKWLGSFETPLLSAHNSYHIRQTYSMKVGDDESLMNVTTPRWSYSNPSLANLLSNGVVGFEIDINAPDAKLGDLGDFPVYHWKTIDETSTCQTLRACLIEIREWYSVYRTTLTAPLLYVDPKDLQDFNQEQLLLLNAIWLEVFTQDALYLPATHTHNNMSAPYPDWSQVCLADIQTKIIPLINIEYSKSLGTEDLLLDLNMFLLCKCQTDAEQCIVLRDECDDDRLAVNATNRLKYLYRVYEPLTQSYPQWIEYPLVYDESVQYGERLLGFQVPDALIEDVHLRFPEYVDQVSNPLTVDEWQYWQTAVFIDSVGNANGLWEKDDFVNYLQTLNPDQGMLDFVVGVLFWKEGYEGSSVLDPLLWAKMKCLWNDDYGLSEFVIAANLSQTLVAICDKIEKGYHYLYADYAYNWTYFQDFTMMRIQSQRMCENITTTKYIQQSKISAGCVSKSELLTTIYGIVAGIVAGVILFILVIGVAVYCLVCRKNGGCRTWCQLHCCKCCCRRICCTKTDEEAEASPSEREQLAGASDL